MEAILEALFETKWGLIILGAFIIIALLIEFWNNDKTPKI